MDEYPELLAFLESQSKIRFDGVIEIPYETEAVGAPHITTHVNPNGGSACKNTILGIHLFNSSKNRLRFYVFVFCIAHEYSSFPSRVPLTSFLEKS